MLLTGDDWCLKSACISMVTPWCTQVSFSQEKSFQPLSSPAQVYFSTQSSACLPPPSSGLLPYQLVYSTSWWLSDQTNLPSHSMSS